jgi:hypothetical protein
MDVPGVRATDHIRELAFSRIAPLPSDCSAFPLTQVSAGRILALVWREGHANY